MSATTGRWVSVARANDIAVGSSRIVRVGDVPLAVFHLDDGWYAIEDVCTHDGGPVAEGRLEGCIIECPRHGARFDLRTGAALCPPAYAPAAVFPIRIEDGVVYVRDDRWGDG